MLKQLKKRNEGFSIIEVLIVLAIAGLIMVVVFIAVPNLQRNARNNRINTEANNLLTAAGEIVNQKGGKMLKSGDEAKITAAANMDTESWTINGLKINTTASPTLDVKQAYIVTSAKCQSDPTTGSVDSATARNFALIYTIEASGKSNTYQCLNG